MSDFPDDPFDDVEADLEDYQGSPDDFSPDELDAIQAADEEALEARSDAEWWEDELERRYNDDELSRAVDDLVRAGCSRARLLADLRELQRIVPGYNRFRNRDLSKLIDQVKQLAAAVELLEYSQLANVLPKERVTSERLARFAEDLDKIRERLKKSPQYWTNKSIADLTGWVDRTVRPRGRVGKRRQHEALALLTSAMLDFVQTARSAGAQRVATSRSKPKQQKTSSEKKPGPVGRPRSSGWRQSARESRKAKWEKHQLD
jgi:hypothetical protein